MAPPLCHGVASGAAGWIGFIVFRESTCERNDVVESVGLGGAGDDDDEQMLPADAPQDWKVVDEVRLPLPDSWLPGACFLAGTARAARGPGLAEPARGVVNGLRVGGQ